MYCLKNKTVRRLAIGLLVVFATLFGGNTFFIHFHADMNGHAVAHSHPFLPGSTHNHSTNQSITIATLNQALLTMDVASTQTVEAPVVDSQRLTDCYFSPVTESDTTFSVGRAPPMA